MSDFPAAHSMDTVWWGVDSEGHVALFVTGEAGAVPPGRTEVPDDGADGLVDQLIAAGAVFSCEDLLPEPDGKLLLQEPPWSRQGPSMPPEEVTRETEARSPSFLLWLRDEAALQRVRATELGERGTLLSAPGKIVLWLPYQESHEPQAPPPELLAVLAWKEQGLLLRGWMWNWGSLDLWRLGIYSYSGGAFGNGTCMPYLREQVPPMPFLLQRLPELRETLHLFELPGADFDLDVLLQLYEHTRAFSWGEDWRGATGHAGMGNLSASERFPIHPAVEVHAPREVSGPEVALVAAYLRGEPAAPAVLGDWLVERGHAPLPPRPTLARRLDQVLKSCFSADQRQRLEADFIEHAAASLSLPEASRAELSHVLSQVRQRLDGLPAGREKRWPQLEEAEPEASRVSWALWALDTPMPLVAARTARALGPEELGFQVQAVLAALSRSAVWYPTGEEPR
jgi:hypothetical protein